mgnify:CR=1 FL=1
MSAFASAVSHHHRVLATTTRRIPRGSSTLKNANSISSWKVVSIGPSRRQKQNQLFFPSSSSLPSSSSSSSSSVTSSKVVVRASSSTEQQEGETFEYQAEVNRLMDFICNSHRKVWIFFWEIHRSSYYLHHPYFRCLFRNIYWVRSFSIFWLD